ncbi:MAG: fatty acid desaturase family protein [Stappiaceae bacterium]
MIAPPPPKACGKDIMDHKRIIAALPREQRKKLIEKTNGPGLLHLVLHAGAIAIVGVFIASGVPYWPVLMVVQGILIVFLFTLLHESIHRTAFRSTWINDVVAALCGFLILLPPNWFRYFHFAHHRHTQDPENDPELIVPKPETVGQYLTYLSGLPTWKSHLGTLLRNARGRCDDAFVPTSAQKQVQGEACLMLATYGGIVGMCIVSGVTLPLYIWVLPVLLGQPFLRLYLLAEHGRCAFVTNMFENSRTTFTNRLVRSLAWNMPYHAEHHAYPGVPFHRLPEFHRMIRTRLTVTEDGYARFHRSYFSELTMDRQ